MLNISSIAQEDRYITFFISKDDDDLVRSGVIKVNGKIKKRIYKVDDYVDYKIVYDKDYIDGYNNIVLEVTYYNNGEKLLSSCNYIHEKTFLFPLFSLQDCTLIDDNCNILFDIINQDVIHNNIDVYINNVKISTLDNSIMEVDIPIAFFNNDINNISFIINYNDNISVIFTYKAIYEDNKVYTSSSWIITKPIYSDKVKRFSRVSYINEGKVHCFYSLNEVDYYKIENGDTINLNNHFIKLMFVMFDDATIKSYKVTFSDFII